jgi:septal ring factor EnvC (AmiA/AmiB activator)
LTTWAWASRSLDAATSRHHFVAEILLLIRNLQDGIFMRIFRCFVCLAVSLAASSCANPKSEAAMAQALSDAANEIGGLKNDVSDLQSQMDSLRTVLARQDTLLSRIAEVNHIPR